ncbi:MAG: response regulator [Acidobacteria bacterium]|nr:response regulator [Acidobacteriota bacterium]
MRTRLGPGLICIGLLCLAPLAHAKERFRATPPTVSELDAAGEKTVRGLLTSTPVPPLRTTPSTAVNEIPASEPVRSRLVLPFAVLTPGENGLPAPVSFTPPREGTSVQHGRTLEAPKVSRPSLPRPVDASPLARRDNALADLGYLDVAQGMLSAYPNAMLEDRRGFLWMTSWGGGLSRYDGTSFLHFTPKQGLPTDKVQALCEDRNGILWIGSSLGLIRWDGTSFTGYTTKQGLAGDNVGQIVEDRKGNLWMSTDKGLCRFDGTSFTTYGKEYGFGDDGIFWILETKDGSALWLATGSGVLRFDGRSFTKMSKENGLPSDGFTALAQDETGALWLSGPAGVSRLQGDALTHFGRAQGLPGEEILQMQIDRGGSLWLSTRRGVVQVKRTAGEVDAFLHLSEEQGLSHYRTAFTFEDRAGFVWIGTIGAGLCRYRQDSFRHVTGKEGLSDQRIWRIAEARDGSNVWLATDKGVNGYDGHSFTHLPVLSPTGKDQIHSVYVAKDGTLWIGTATAGIYHYDGARLTHVVPEDGASFGRVWSFAEDSEGGLWIGSATGAVRWDGTFFTRPSELQNSAFYDLTAGPDGAVWFARRKGGVLRLSGRSLTRLDPAGPIGKAEVNRLYFDPHGRLWIGTRTGIAVHDGGQLFFIDEDDGLSNPLVFSLSPDSLGSVWAATEKGLNRVTLGPGKDAVPRVDAYGTEEGLKAADFNQGTGLWDSHGRGYWGTGKALCMLAAVPPLTALPAPPPVQLVGLDLRKEPVDWAELASKPKDGPFKDVVFQGVVPFLNLPEGLDLPHDVADIGFHVSAVDWGHAHRIEYQSMLANGRGADWGPASRERTATYTNLPPGSYVFRARARIGTGDWGPAVDLAFRVLPPWWLTVWAKALWSVLGLAAVAGLVKLRVRSLEKRRAELETLVEVRTAELEREKERALDASRAKSLFLANMSHELRTPLNAVLGFAQLLNRSSDLSRRHQEELGIIQRSGEHLLGLIDDVLSLSKIEARSFTRVDRPFDLHELLAAVQSIVRVRADAKDLELAFELGSSFPRTVNADAGKLRQVLINLLGNAVKFTERGRVTLRARWTNGRATFEIEDTGPGISEEELGKLFRAFSQTESGLSAKEGTGLGLVISRQIVRLMGGDVSVKSTVGVGTTFTFDVELPASEAAIAPRKRRKVLSLAPDQPALRILVVDDTPENRLLLMRLLGDAGFDVREAVNGADAIAAWETWKPHLVFMDMRMPVMDGREATARIREREKAEGESPTPIVALTASALEHEREELASSGVSGFLPKPFVVDDLFAALAQHTGVRYRYADDADPSGPLPAALPGVDTAAGLRRASGNALLYRQLLGQAVRELGGAVPRIEALLAQGGAGAGDLIHTLKGSSATLGMRRVAEELGALEESLRKSPESRPELLPLAAAIEEVRTGCEDLLVVVATAPAVASSGPVDAGRAKEALEIAGRLRGLLEEGSLDAPTEVARLKAVLGEQLADLVSQLEDAASRLDVPAALAVLSELEARALPGQRSAPRSTTAATVK